jgi:putative GTP pyrophosphokinase
MNNDFISSGLNASVASIFDRVGIFNRVFSRIKSENSISSKLAVKGNHYTLEGKKMQDFVGIRITLYFLEDEEIAIQLLKNNFVECALDHSIDPYTVDTFSARRCNLIFRIPNEYINFFPENDLIDRTFEVQVRTIFSEGWHEVEHDLRYKCKEDWIGHDMLSRQLNGIYATLTNCDWLINAIFKEMMLDQLDRQDWTAFFRSALRIRLENNDISSKILGIINKAPNIFNMISAFNRSDFLIKLSKLPTRLPLTMDNMIFLLNRIHLKNLDIANAESSILKQIFTKLEPN